MNGKQRARAGIITSSAGIILNLVLAALKIAAGVIFNAVSVAADGFNNLSDCASGAASVLSFKISEKPADKEHPYGHRRAEYVASMVIGFLVLFVAAELFRESVVKTATDPGSEDSPLVFAVLGVSVAVKAAMYVFYRAQAKRLQSDALRAAAADSAADSAATLAVICGALISKYTVVSADGWVGAIVALFIAWEGVSVLREAGSKLLGQAPDPQLVNSVRDELLGGLNVLGIHDLKIYGFGRGAYVATVHVEMPASVPPLEAHAEIDRLEHCISEKYKISVTAHIDPVDLNDAEALELERAARAACKDMADGLELHDFRLVRGIGKKLIFEAGVPFSCPHTDKELREKILAAVEKACSCEAVVTVERE